MSLKATRRNIILLSSISITSALTTSKQTQPLAEIAAIRVLRRMLGSQMYDVTKYHLNHRYHIELEGNSKRFFDLDELKLALIQLIGAGAAGLIMKEIYTEYDSLAS